MRNRIPKDPKPDWRIDIARRFPPILEIGQGITFGCALFFHVIPSGARNRAQASRAFSIINVIRPPYVMSFAPLRMTPLEALKIFGWRDRIEQERAPFPLLRACDTNLAQLTGRLQQRALDERGRRSYSQVFARAF